MNEEALIILVQEHECLYNLAHKDYDNNLIKENIWKDIARSLSTTVDICKNKWTLLRGYYRRALHRKKTKSGQSAKNKKKWRFECQMEPYLHERETHSNLKYSQNSSMDEEVEEENDYSVESVVESQVDDTDSFRSVPSPTLSSLEAQPSCSKESAPLRTRMGKSTRQSHYSSSNTSSQHSKRKAQDERDPLSESLSAFIKFKQSESSQKVVNTASTAKKRNLLNFFDDLAETILSFPELEQAEMKRDIFTLVNKKQIELLRGAREPPLQGNQNSYYPQQVHAYTTFPSSTAQLQPIYHAQSHGNNDSYAIDHDISAAIRENI